MPKTIKIIAEQAIKESISVLSILFSESSPFFRTWMNGSMNDVSDERENDERHWFIYELFRLLGLPIIMSGICYSRFAC